MYQPAMSDTANHASTRRQARTDGGGGEKESSVPELCSLESVCGQACVYRHIARCVFTTIFINYKYSCSGVFNFIIPKINIDDNNHKAAIAQSLQHTMRQGVVIL